AGRVRGDELGSLLEIARARRSGENEHGGGSGGWERAHLDSYSAKRRPDTTRSHRWRAMRRFFTLPYGPTFSEGRRTLREEIVDQIEDVGDVHESVRIDVPGADGSGPAGEERVDEVEDVGDARGAVAVHVAADAAGVELRIDAGERVVLVQALPRRDDVAVAEERDLGFDLVAGRV